LPAFAIKAPTKYIRTQVQLIEKLTAIEAKQKQPYRKKDTMTLYKKLQEANSEEDVKDAYIKALGLKGYSKNLIDIQTKEIWFEAKDSGKSSTYAMFTQLMHYVQQALNKGDYVPPFRAVIDTHKAAIVKRRMLVRSWKRKLFNGVKVQVYHAHLPPCGRNFKCSTSNISETFNFVKPMATGL
jgi:hypothetical protein